MAKQSPKDESLFLVSLEGFGLSKDQKNRIEDSIKGLILKELAAIDNGGDIQISRRFTNDPLWSDYFIKGILLGYQIKGFPIPSNK